MRAAMPEAHSDECITVAKIGSVSTKVVKSTSESKAAKCSAWLCDVSSVSVISFTSIQRNRSIPNENRENCAEGQFEKF